MEEMAQIRASTVQQKMGEMFAALKYEASSLCLVEEWRDCEELKPHQKKSGPEWRRKGKQRSIEWSGVRRQASTVA